MKLRAIIIEDSELCRILLSVMLETRGYEILSYSDPTVCPLYSMDSCTCPKEDPCSHILLIDNRLPHMSGLDFIERQMEKGCKAAVSSKAVFSASWLPKDLARAEKLGCKVFDKPYDKEAIWTWLDEQEEKILAAKNT